jgi:hypothetical protein
MSQQKNKEIEMKEDTKSKRFPGKIPPEKREHYQNFAAQYERFEAGTVGDRSPMIGKDLKRYVEALDQKSNDPSAAR